jgi:hypothetical protein
MSGRTVQPAPSGQGDIEVVVHRPTFALARGKIGVGAGVVIALLAATLVAYGIYLYRARLVRSGRAPRQTP